MSCRGRGTAHASEHRAGLRPTPRPGSPWLSACAQPDQSPPTRASRARSLWIAAYPALTMWTTKTAGRRRRIVVVRATTILGVEPEPDSAHERLGEGLLQPRHEVVVRREVQRGVVLRRSLATILKIIGILIGPQPQTLTQQAPYVGQRHHRGLRLLVVQPDLVPVRGPQCHD